MFGLTKNHRDKGVRYAGGQVKDNEAAIVLISDYIKYTVQGIVDCPDAVEVRAQMGEQTCVFNLTCDRSDLGKVIGKQGRMAQALRTLLNSAATKHQLRAVLEILE